MNFDVDRLVDMMEKRLGNFIATAFLAFLVFGISVWILRFIVNDAFLPLLSGLEKINIGEAGGWSIARVLFLLLLFLMIIGFIYLATAINKAKRTSKSLEEDRSKLVRTLAESIETSENLEKREKELNNLLENTKEKAEKLRQAQEDFEKRQDRYRNR